MLEATGVSPVTSCEIVMVTSSSCDSGKTVTVTPGSASSVYSITKEYSCGTAVVTRSRAAFIVLKLTRSAPTFHVLLICRLHEQ